MKNPKGVLAVLFDSHGQPQAEAADFLVDRPGGFTQFQAQRHRAKQQLSTALVENLCHRSIADVLSSYDKDKIMGNLVRDKGWSLHIIPIGHTKEESE